MWTKTWLSDPLHYYYYKSYSPTPTTTTTTATANITTTDSTTVTATTSTTATPSIAILFPFLFPFPFPSLFPFLLLFLLVVLVHSTSSSSTSSVVVLAVVFKEVLVQPTTSNPQFKFLGFAVCAKGRERFRERAAEEPPPGTRILHNTHIQYLFAFSLDISLGHFHTSKSHRKHKSLEKGKPKEHLVVLSGIVDGRKLAKRSLALTWWMKQKKPTVVAEVLPTGKNMHALDPNSIPTKAGWGWGWEPLLWDFSQLSWLVSLASAIDERPGKPVT